MKIDKKIAAAIFRQEATSANESAANQEWIVKVEKLSQLCEDGIAKTHIAFFGTEVLAKCINPAVDLYAIKPTLDPDNQNAYSARTLCHSVIVPLAAELGINIGVTGREPLNNQPYFRMTRLGDDTPVHQGGKAAYEYMLELIATLSQYDAAQARKVLKAYIVVRKRYQLKYTEAAGSISISPTTLTDAIKNLVGTNSENGRRAQAVVAGLMDVSVGSDRVESGRINDPSRKYPGDVCIKAANHLGWIKAIEVRDKPVLESDIHIFAKKCLSMSVHEAVVVMASDRQKSLDEGELQKWAGTSGIGLKLFYGWDELTNQALFWSDYSSKVAANLAVEFIETRLIAVEATNESITLWHKATRS